MLTVMSSRKISRQKESFFALHKTNDFKGLGKENNEDDSGSSIYGFEEDDEADDANFIGKKRKKSKPEKKYSTLQLVDPAIFKLKEKSGSSVPAIKKAIMVEYPEMNKLPKSVLTAEAKKKTKDGKALQPQEIVPIKITRAEAIIKPKHSPANPSLKVKTADFVPNANPEPDPKKKNEIRQTNLKIRQENCQKVASKISQSITASGSKTAKKKVSKDGEPLKAPNQQDPEDINNEATSVKSVICSQN
uniref:H15 domain-containing protein n=1 Tax=Glossina austeni TaxID=7395 RepID=A0A1A9UFD3_GLOAU